MLGVARVGRPRRPRDAMGAGREPRPAPEVCDHHALLPYLPEWFAWRRSGRCRMVPPRSGSETFHAEMLALARRGATTGRLNQHFRPK